MEKFKYSNSLKVVDWGFGFDSILELKYAISIQAEYEFLHAPAPIFYDPVRHTLLNEPRRNSRRYSPDFLIRHRTGKKAYWIEIKPEYYTDQRSLILKQMLANRFIEKYKLDWEFRIIYGNEIKLNIEQLSQFNECCSYLFASKKIPASVNPFSCLRTSLQLHFVMYGTDSHKSFWKR